jgi:hypothetical protein
MPAMRARDPCLTLPPEFFRFYGWQPFQPWGVVKWCGHRVEGIPVPDADGRSRLNPLYDVSPAG